MVAHHRRQPAFDEIDDLGLHRLHFGLHAQEIGHWRIQSGQGPELGFIVRIGQHAHIEHEVGIHRHAALEAERLEHQCQ
jgi:hypothetical protein